MAEKQHFYLISFLGGGARTVASIRIGWPDQRVTEARLQECRGSLEVPDSAVPIAVSYLGHMTPEEAGEATIPTAESGERWEARLEAGANSHVFDTKIMLGDDCIAFVDSGAPHGHRLVLALNALAGIEDPEAAVAEVREALEKIAAEQEMTDALGLAYCAPVCSAEEAQEIAREALALLGPAR